VFVWDVTSGQTLRRLSGHIGRVYAVEFNADAAVLASGMPVAFSSCICSRPAGSYDASVRLWDLKCVCRPSYSDRVLTVDQVAEPRADSDP
jgi:mitogen-activated protein kinase organizer 1